MTVSSFLIASSPQLESEKTLAGGSAAFPGSGKWRQVKLGLAETKGKVPSMESLGNADLEVSASTSSGMEPWDWAKTTQLKDISVISTENITIYGVCNKSVKEHFES